MKNLISIILFLCLVALIFLGVFGCQQKTYPTNYEYMGSRKVPTWNVWVTSEEQIDSAAVEFVDPVKDSIDIIMDEYYKRP